MKNKLKKYFKFALLGLGIICLNMSFRENLGVLLLFLAYLDHRGILFEK